MKSSFGIILKNLVKFRWMSGISSIIFPFKTSVSRENRKKSKGLRSGECGGCSVCTTHCFARNCVWASVAMKKVKFNIKSNFCKENFKLVVVLQIPFNVLFQFLYS